MRKKHHYVFDLWCQWCVDAGRYIPFEEWSGYTLKVDPYLKALADYEGIPMPQREAEAGEAKDTLEEVQKGPQTPRPTLPERIDMFQRGEFDPSEWNWCVGWSNSRIDGEPHSIPSLYIMGQGAEQLLQQYSWEEHVTLDQIANMVRKQFKVEQVMYGVG